MKLFHVFLFFGDMDKVLNILIPVFLFLSTNSPRPIIVVNIHFYRWMSNMYFNLKMGSVIYEKQPGTLTNVAQTN